MKQLDLSPFFKTKNQANDFSTRLSGITSHLYDIDFNLEKTLFDTFGMQKKDKFMVLLREHDIAPDNISGLKAFFELIQTTITQLPVLEMTIAFEPKEQTLAALTDWFVMNLKKQVLLTVTIDHSLIAGAKINYSGKFFDGSVKPIFDTLLTESISTK